MRTLGNHSQQASLQNKIHPPEKRSEEPAWAPPCRAVLGFLPFRSFAPAPAQSSRLKELRKTGGSPQLQPIPPPPPPALLVTWARALPSCRGRGRDEAPERPRAREAAPLRGSPGKSTKHVEEGLDAQERLAWARRAELRGRVARGLPARMGARKGEIRGWGQRGRS